MYSSSQQAHSSCWCGSIVARAEQWQVFIALQRGRASIGGSLLAHVGDLLSWVLDASSWIACGASCLTEHRTAEFYVSSFSGACQLERASWAECRHASVLVVMCTSSLPRLQQV